MAGLARKVAALQNSISFDAKRETIPAQRSCDAPVKIQRMVSSTSFSDFSLSWADDVAMIYEKHSDHSDCSIASQGFGSSVANPAVVGGAGSDVLPTGHPPTARSSFDAFPDPNDVPAPLASAAVSSSTSSLRAFLPMTTLSMTLSEKSSSGELDDAVQARVDDAAAADAAPAQQPRSLYAIMTTPQPRGSHENERFFHDFREFRELTQTGP